MLPQACFSKETVLLLADLIFPFPQHLTKLYITLNFQGFEKNITGVFWHKHFRLQKNKALKDTDQ